jgi:hypothetical protein
LAKTEYGTSYFGVRDPEHARRDLDRFANAGLDAVLHTFSERDQKYYRETMEGIVRASHERNLTVYMNPWGLGNVFGGEALTEFSGHNPEACQQLSNGDRVPAACFNAPAFREFVHQWIEDAVRTGADVIFWDEPHWLEPAFRDDEDSDEYWTCRCPSCRSRYEEVHGQKMPEAVDDSVKTFKRNSIVNFLEEMTEATAEAGAQNAVCLAPDPTENDSTDRLKRLASLKHLDLIGATPFWDLHGEDPRDFVGGWSERITSVADSHNLKSQIWIQGFDLDDSRETIEKFRMALDVAKSSGPDSLFLWGWDGCRVMSSKACESAETIWSEFLNAVE